MPPARDFGWALRDTNTSAFDICRRDNGQFCVVLNHALLRGCTAAMLRWWFLHFTRLRVRLPDTPDYEGKQVPAYWLWHPIDHLSATLTGSLGPGGTARVGAKIKIQEAMQYDRYGWRYPVDSTVGVFYVGADGWAMGRVLPLLGPVMMLRIHFVDAKDEAGQAGVHYHYEIVIGASGSNPVAKFVNHRITSQFSPEFFEAWQRHNVIEVGTFENFLPILYAQRDNTAELSYERSNNAMPQPVAARGGFDAEFQQSRLAGYRNAADPFAYQQYAAASMLA